MWWFSATLSLLGLSDKEHHSGVPLHFEDISSLVQGQTTLHRGLVLRRQEPERPSESFESGTIGDVSPHLISDDAMEAMMRRSGLSNGEEDDEQSESDTGLNEATAETLAASISSGLHRISARLDTHLERIMHLKDEFRGALEEADESDQSQAFEDEFMKALDAGHQGGATVAAVLRSSVASTQASLETAGLRDLAAAVEDSLGNSLTNYELALQPTFLRAKGLLTGLGKEPGDATSRVIGLREALQSHRQQANALGHALYKQFQDIALAISKLLDAGSLPAVAAQRVRTALHAVQESAAAIAWKLYLPAWELSTSAGEGAVELGLDAERPEAESDDELLGGALPALETSPLKPAAAGAVTRGLDSTEERAEALLAASARAKEELQAAVAKHGRSRSRRLKAALAEVEAKWESVCEALERTAKSITQCLETAGEHAVGEKLDSLFDEALDRSQSLTAALDEPAMLKSSIDAFLQEQDVLAQSFFHIYHEFMNGMGHSSSGGAQAQAVSLHNWRASHPQRLMHADGEVEGLCMALGGHAQQQARAAVLDDEDGELAQRMVRRAQEAAFGSVQQAAAISWRLHSSAWLLASALRKATAAP